jgi:sugar/nucleoside kinase (ribokinase family)
MRDLIGQADLFCLLNWSCLPGMDSIFDWLLDDIMPSLPTADDNRIFFFDLADPSPRIAELTSALERIARFAAHGRCVIGMNFNETLLVCNALGIEQPGHSPDSLCHALASIRSKLGIHMAMGHSMEFVACADTNGTASVEGIITPKPVITTGAGDHLNAGFCLGLLLRLDLPDVLALGVLFPGFYVREARPPTLSELPEFIFRLQSNPSNA